MQNLHRQGEQQHQRIAALEAEVATLRERLSALEGAKISAAK